MKNFFIYLKEFCFFNCLYFYKILNLQLELFLFSKFHIKSKKTMKYLKKLTIEIFIQNFCSIRKLNYEKFKNYLLVIFL